MDSNFDVLRVSASGLYAQRARMNLIASNMANAHTTRTQEGGPYRRQDIVFTATPMGKEPKDGISGVNVSEVVEDQSPFKQVYDPGNPDADKDGVVQMPNVDPLAEMVNMMMASRAYEANVSTFNLSKGIFKQALQIGK